LKSKQVIIKEKHQEVLLSVTDTLKSQSIIIQFKQIGRTEKGIGVIVEKDDVKRKTNHITALFKYNNDYIPENFQGECYVFRIPAEKLSDTEYEFKFCNAKMKNKK